MTHARFAVRFIACALTFAAIATPAAAARFDAVATGELFARDGGGDVPMPLLTMDVAIDVTGILATTRLVQRFDNVASSTVEAVYVFPLPERAAIRHMEIRVGDRRITARVEEREEARRTYEAARDAGKKAAVVEQERPNLFTTSVANVNPGETVEVVLEYQEEVACEGDRFDLTFPMTFTPRYVPGSCLVLSATTGMPSVISAVVPDADRVTPPFRLAHDPRAPRAAFRATIRAGFPLAGVRCLSHAARVEERDGAWTVVADAAQVLADRDLHLEWTARTGEAPEASLLVQTADGASYGLLMLVPPRRTDAGRGLPTRTLFVIDVSGSMAGPSIEQARRALVQALGRLRPADRFDVLAFNQQQWLFADDFVAADPRTTARAQRWVENLEADGGTEIHPALLRGLGLFGPERAGEVSRILFLTDGAVGNEAQILGEVATMLGSIRVHAVGIGMAPNRWFIRKLAETGHGLATFVFDTATVESALTTFLARIERPVLSDVALELNGSAAEVYPSRLPDLHDGEPLVVSLRWTGAPPASVTVRGRTSEGPYARRVVATGIAPDADAIATRWARAKVEDLMDTLNEGADPDTVRRDVVAVGLAHHLVTSYTSLVAVEERVTAAGESTPAPVAAALPHGSELLGTLPQGGTLATLRIALALLCLATGVLLMSGEGYLRVKGALAGVLIDRALARHLGDGKAHAPWGWADMHPVARLEVDRLGVRAPVLSGASGESMAFGIGHIAGTAAPNDPGNCALAGHRDTALAWLANVRAGDRITLVSAEESAGYRVVDARVVDRHEVDVLAPTPDSRLTLVTCWPFGALLHGEERYVVVAERE